MIRIIKNKYREKYGHIIIFRAKITPVLSGVNNGAYVD